jgi:hypothetical protein
MKSALRAAVAAVMAISASSAVADDAGHEWTGFRLGITGAGLIGHAPDRPAGAPPATFGIAGGMLGAIARFDYDFGRFVAGLGIDWTYSSVAGSYVGTPNSGAFHLDRTSTVLFRAGIGMGANLFYVQTGFNFSRVTLSGGPTGSQDTDTITFHSGFRRGYGRHFGVGMEHAFGGALSAFVEYRFVFLGDELVDLGPTNPGTAHFVAASGQTIRTGFSFRFGG